jgi:hypothetical protein
MQPETSNLPLGSEKAPVVPAQNAEHLNMPTLPAPEAGIETGAERREQTAELQAVTADAAATAAPLAPVVIDPINPPTTRDDATVTPLVAGNDDVIEKEWVDKAKKIILDTKEDPFKREEQVSQLQKDYLKKRYGKDLGAAV